MILHAEAPPGQDGIPFSLRVRHADSSWRTLEGLAVRRLDDPAVEGIILGARDVTAQNTLVHDSANR